MSVLLTLVPLVLALTAARMEPSVPRAETLSRWLRSRWAPVLAGALTAAIVIWVQGGLHPIPRVHDGAAYLLQARIFATFRWFAPAPPLPEFFEQFHVFVTPVTASKYPPGQSLLMVPGIWLGLPALVPVLMSGLSGGLVFVLARRLSSEWTALITWLLWTSSRGVMRFLPSYLSQTTTCALWLLGWWALLRWRDSRQGRWLVLFAGCVGWGLITHPFTWILYLIPGGWVVISLANRRRAWPAVALASVAGAACLALLPVWNERITGNPLEMTWSAYARVYFPDDRLGLGATSLRPERALPADMQQWDDSLHAFHVGYTARHLPTALARRLLVIWGDGWGPNRALLSPFALLGLYAASSELLLALATCGVLVAGFLAFGFDAGWSAYYVELLPVLAYLTALGIARAACLARRPQLLDGKRCRSQLAAPAISSLVFMAAFIPNAAMAVDWGNRFQKFNRNEQLAFRGEAVALADSRTVVFVRYGEAHNVAKSLITNDPDWSRSPMWIVHDRGADDIRLIRLAPDRMPYLYDGARGTLTPIDTTILKTLNASATSAPVTRHRP